ncbi:MAG TPA: ATP-binding cassette domain-containing protein, partial [Thermoanaerobaculia bacterium]|nr:ATP-binding cassette domain-containing protein [Thermoanaerobaculia bacterium]
YLFTGTVASNLRFGKPEASDDELWAALATSQAKDFVEAMPDKLGAPIAQGGTNVSGGQRQRLSIARAILKDAPILVLDEATSAVDTETERAIQQNLRRITRGRTALVIAHRLSTLRHADRILVLTEGRVAEEGHHDELVARGGIYADLWHVQSGDLAEELVPG